MQACRNYYNVGAATSLEPSGVEIPRGATQPTHMTHGVTSIAGRYGSFQDARVAMVVGLHLGLSDMIKST